MSADPHHSIAAIQSLSADEKRWQPAPEAFLRMVDPALRPAGPAEGAAEAAPLVGLALERHRDLYVWVIVRGSLGGSETRFTELARASTGDDTAQQAWGHGLQALCVMDVPSV